MLRCLISTGKVRVLPATVAVLVTMLLSVGCASVPQMPVRAERYRIDVKLDPSTHRILGRTTIDLLRADVGESTDVPFAGRGTVGVPLLLHPDLRIKSVRASGATVRTRTGARLSDPDRQAQSSESNLLAPRRHVVFLDHPADALTLFVEYEGTLFQDAAAGERPGEIHNLQMQAHIGEDGIYLAGGYWYPQPESEPAVVDAESDSRPAMPALADFSLISDPVPGFELVAAGERDTTFSRETGRLAWRSPYPLPEMVLVGGKHQIHRREHQGIEIALHLKPEQAEQAAGLFDAVQYYLDRYQPLIGSYPAREYRVVDNFFSSGFAFPTFTLLSSAVIDMGERAQRTHGYLDHEMLHSWWGNGIHVDPRDGNWCEALASYGANYYGFVLDGDEDEARRKRRNYSHFLSRLEPEKDKPLGTFGREDGCGRSIGYDKGAAVFQMLEWTIGREAFWSAMQRLTAEFVGDYASWEDLRSVFEAESGRDLSPFFDQWVRRGGAPQLLIDEARFDSAGQRLHLTLSQGDPAFNLQIPIRITFGDRSEDVIVALRGSRETVSIPVEGIPTSVELDPEYHVFRKIPPQQILPTTAATRSGQAFTAVLPTGDMPDSYRKIQSVFESSFEPQQRMAATVGSLSGEHLAERSVLILGEAVRDGYVSAFLSAVEFPVHWIEGGFEFDGEPYTDPGDAVLCTLAHPGVTGGGITVVYANSREVMPSAFAIPMYDRSLVIFSSGRAVLRHDFEHRAVVEVAPL